MRHYSVFVCVDPVCCCGANNNNILRAGIAFMQLISAADTVAHIVHSVWPAATVISGSYGCL